LQKGGKRLQKANVPLANLELVVQHLETDAQSQNSVQATSIAEAAFRAYEPLKSEPVADTNVMPLKVPQRESLPPKTTEEAVALANVYEVHNQMNRVA
jgi:hypothetical protein